MGEIIFLGFLSVIVLWVAFIFLTKRGRGVMFGGKIIKSWDGVTGKRKIVTSRAKVHAVDVSPSVRIVGLELSASIIGSSQMIPISLPATEAVELARILKEAAEYRADGAETET